MTIWCKNGANHEFAQDFNVINHATIYEYEKIHFSSAVVDGKNLMDNLYRLFYLVHKVAYMKTIVTMVAGVKIKNLRALSTCY